MNLPARLLAAAALALATIASPAPAAAGHHRARSHGPSFPMKADDFRKLMDKRIDHVRATIDKKLDRHGVTSERKKAIHRIFDEASRDLRAEIDRAAADGTVTQAEADKVKTLTTGLRARVRERLRAEKNPKLKEKLAREEAAQREHAAQEAAQKKEEAVKREHAAQEAAHPPGSAEAKPKVAAKKPAKPVHDTAAKHDKPGAGHDAGQTKTAKASSKKHKPAKAAPSAEADL